MVLKKFTPSRWIAFLVTSWGIVATLTGVVQNYAGLIVCRLILGALEGGLFPGMTIYLTMFYTKRELALRVGMVGLALFLLNITNHRRIPFRKFSDRGGLRWLARLWYRSHGKLDQKYIADVVLMLYRTESQANPDGDGS